MPLDSLTLEEGRGLFFSQMSTVMVQRRGSLTVEPMPLEITSALMLKMQVSSVKVRRFDMTQRCIIIIMQVL